MWGISLVASKHAIVGFDADASYPARGEVPWYKVKVPVPLAEKRITNCMVHPANILKK